MKRAERAARKERRAEGDLASSLHALGLEWDREGDVQRAHMRLPASAVPPPLPSDVSWEAPHVIMRPEGNSVLAWLARGLDYVACAEGRPVEHVLGDELRACAGVLRAGAWLLLAGWLVALHLPK